MSFNDSLLHSQGLWPAVGAAFVLGLTGSLHCVLMCGPLACAANAGSVDARSRWTTSLAYQSSRVGSYLLAGALLGGLGAGVGRAMSVSIRPWLPWVMALAFLAAALEWGRFLPALPGVGRLASAIACKTYRWPPTTRAMSIGLSTAFLPCGLLYGVLAVSASSGSIWEGALLAGTFALAAFQPSSRFSGTRACGRNWAPEANSSSAAYCR